MLQKQGDTSCGLKIDKISVRKIIPAMSTPLASIFGSGFLVVVPVLASAVGPYALPAMVVVALVAFFVGTVIRHNILCAEPVLANGSQPMTLFVERVSAFALIAAYVVSICLYVHILSAFALASVEMDTEFNKSMLTTIVKNGNSLLNVIAFEVQLMIGFFYLAQMILE